MGSAMAENSVVDYGDVSTFDVDVIVSFQQRIYVVIFGC